MLGIILRDLLSLRTEKNINFSHQTHKEKSANYSACKVEFVKSSDILEYQLTLEKFLKDVSTQWFMDHAQDEWKGKVALIQHEFNHRHRVLFIGEEKYL